MIYRSQPISRLQKYGANRRFLLITLLLAFSIITLQMANLTVRQHAAYAEQAEDNLFAYRRLSAPRGNIFDRNGEPLATNHRTWSLTYSAYRQDRDKAKALLEDVRERVGVPDEVDMAKLLDTKDRWTRHRLLRHATQDQVLPFLERPGSFPGLRTEEDFKRDYLQPTDFAHVLGYLGKIQPDEVETFTRPRYLPDDDIGRAGLERAFEDELAPVPGRERQQRNARVTSLGPADVLEPAEPGKNLFLSVDAKLQKRAMELLRGHTGTIILMDAKNGELLTVASSPTFDPENLGRRVVEGQEPGYLNLAVRGQYAPGSTFKIVVAAAALKAGIDPSATHYCNGAFRLPGWNVPFHCANRSGHGHTDLLESLQFSCNVYYFETAQELGAAPIRQMAEAFGFGEPTGTDLPGEKAGSVPSLAELAPGELTNFSIGQGKLLSTPLQVARAYAALANGGRLPTPHVVRAIGDDPENAAPVNYPSRQVGLTERQLRLIGDGLFRVANSPGGTAFKSDFPARWEIAGKTGSVERGTDETDAWFASFFPRSAPTHVLVVQLEEAGHGGEEAAPVAKEFLRTFFGEDEADVEVAAQ